MAILQAKDVLGVDRVVLAHGWVLFESQALCAHSLRYLAVIVLDNDLQNAWAATMRFANRVRVDSEGRLSGFAVSCLLLIL